MTVSYQRLFPLILCAGLAALRGDWERSARFEGVATFHIAQLGWPLDPPDRAYVESLSNRTRAALGDAAFERLHATARGLPLEEALAQMRQYLREEPERRAVSARVHNRRLTGRHQTARLELSSAPLPSKRSPQGCDGHSAESSRQEVREPADHKRREQPGSDERSLRRPGPHARADARAHGLIRHPVPSHVPQNQGQHHQTQRRAEHASK